MQEGIKDQAQGAPKAVASEEVSGTTSEPVIPGAASAGGGTGLTPNVAGALCYLVGFITGIVFLMIERENKFVRFHAMQSIVFSVALVVVGVVLGFIPILGWALGLLVNLAAVVLWIVLMIKAYQGEEWEIPVLGKIAREQVAKMG